MGSQLENLLSNSSLDLDVDPGLLGLLVDSASDNPAPAAGPNGQMAPASTSASTCGPGGAYYPYSGGAQGGVFGQSTILPLFGPGCSPPVMSPFVIPERGLPAAGGQPPGYGMAATGAHGGDGRYAAPADVGPGAGPSGGPGGAVDEKTATILRRQAAIQAKNRRAQKRFRERQKAKMTNLEEQVEGLCAQLEELKTQNTSLANKNDLLTKVLQMKDEQMCVLQEGAKVFDNARSRAEPARLSSTSMTQTSVCTMAKQPKALEGNHFPTSKFYELTAEEVRETWKAYVNQLSMLLVNLGTDASQTDAEPRILQLVSEMGELCCKTATLCPVNMKKLLMGSFESPGTQPSLEDRELEKRWDEVLKTVSLTGKQEDMVLELRSAFLLRMKTLWQQRAILNRRFQECVGFIETRDLSGTQSSGTQSTCSASLKVAEIVEELRDSLHRETQYHYDFISSFFQNVVDDMQAAHLCVQSYPYYPDILVISNILAAERGVQLDWLKNEPGQ
eukprot:evm.model.scf_1030EXC.2 EVM.evm.TU.scf_1030EXC.2   scf_1030EXC:10030-17223(+)